MLTKTFFWAAYWIYGTASAVLSWQATPTPTYIPDYPPGNPRLPLLGAGILALIILGGVIWVASLQRRSEQARHVNIDND